MSFELMPFQTVGANLLSTSRRAMLVWDAGTGKTPPAARAAMKVGARRVLVYCPPIAVAVWRQHFRDWTNIPDIRVLDALAAAKPYSFMSGAGVRIVPYSRLVGNCGIVDVANRDRFDVVIIDEGHYLKNSEAIRTKGVYGRRLDLRDTPLERADHVWVLTGTPILNHAQEFWTHLRALRPDLIVLPQLGRGPMDEAIFTDRYCVTRSTPNGPRIIGSKNIHELAGRIKAFIDRKRMRDVRPEMPALRIVDHPLPADTPIDPKLRAELIDAVADLNDKLAGTDPVTDDELLAAVQSNSVAFSTVRRLIGRAKVDGVTAMVNDFMSDSPDAKLILFAHHREVIRDLTYNLKRHHPLVITGATTLKVREQMISDFQTKPNLRLIILAIEAAGEVITLHAAHNVFVMEPSPVPAKNQQAIARAHRAGQLHPVLARFILLPGTLDARLMAIVARKTREIAQLVDGAATAELAPQAALDFPDTI